MISGTCPKCGSTVILRSKRGGWPGLHQIHIQDIDVAFVECLICSECGFVEAYVPADLDRRKMLRAFERYQPGSEAFEDNGSRDGSGPAD